MSEITHYPWDGGAIDAAFKEVFGVGTKHKTVKTRCEKRVSTAHASPEGVTCPECRAAIQSDIDFCEQMKRERPDLPALKTLAGSENQWRKALGQSA